MKNYLITIITVSICIGIYNVLSPMLRGIEKYSKMIGMLIVLCVVISPLKEIAKKFNDEGLQNIKDNILNTEEGIESEYDEIFKDYLNSFSVDELKKEIKNILLKEFEVPENECAIIISTEYKEEKLTLNNVQILLSGKSIFKNPYKIEEHFTNLLGCNCQVLLK